MKAPDAFRFALAATVDAMAASTSLSRRGVARAAGLDTAPIYRYINGETMPSVASLNNIAQACGWTLTRAARLIEKIENCAPATIDEARKIASRITDTDK